MSMSQPMQVFTSQQTNDWYTPPHVIAWVREILGSIELDPASCEEANKIVQAQRYYTLADNALALKWHARTVFLNPPFDATPKWLDKLAYQYNEGRVHEAVMLVNSKLGYNWFESAWRKYTVCHLRERVHFVAADGSDYGAAKCGQTLIYMGPDDSRFASVLAPHGRVFRP